ncbi:hypothetical protein ES319_A08G096400v1 [Gossypium barbadense]|uniref:Uncharacterized protein n=2 Tax=Gossypium TaxID=3633 RepID=A0A5J5UPJ2_GOSBA|nr:hypothetical protein ES319_A08G096400v1 [Gossypium barbadense]TYH05733.1 hypothetical protein ES288_A08G105300v1 [Gossypium darwinii]
MRPSCLAVSLLVFLIVLSSIEGIRLEKISKSMHPKLQCKTYCSKRECSLMKNSNGVRGDDILSKEGHCRGTKRKKAHKVFKRSHHWIPSIHEDYRGPRRHRPRHH